MKSKILIGAALFALVFSSCKKDAETTTEGTTAPAVEEKIVFKAEFDVIAEKDDSFAIYYTEDDTTNFPPENAVWGTVKGQAEPQKVTFDFPVDALPTDLRFDFGLKKGAEQGDVTLQSFKLSYAGKEFVAKGSEFYAYFSANKDVKAELDETKGTIKFPKNPAGTTTPIFYPMPLLKEQIKKLTQQ